MPKFADRECKVTPARVWRRCSADCKKKRRCPSNHFTKSLGPWTGSGWKQCVALFGLARTPLLHTSRKSTLSDPSSAASCHPHSQRQEDSRKPSPRLVPKHTSRDDSSGVLDRLPGRPASHGCPEHPQPVVKSPARLVGSTVGSAVGCWQLASSLSV